MSFCSFSRDSAMFDSTPIENMFLLEHMPQLPDECLRVYLYARMLCCHQEMDGGIEDLAKALCMDQDTVLEAFLTLERRGLVEKMSDRPPTFAFRSLNSGVAVKQDSDIRRHLDYNSAVLKILETASIGSRQSRITFDWLDVLGFSQEAALKLLEYEKKVSGAVTENTIIRRADKRAMEWAERGIHSLEDVERAIAYDDQVWKTAYAVLKNFNLSRKPTDNELDLARRWVHEWQMSEDEVIAACIHTTKARNPSFAYLDAILKDKAEGGNPHFLPTKAILTELGASVKTPAPEQMKKYAELLDAGFEPETIMVAASQCANKNWHSFEKLVWMLDSWSEAGVRTRAQADIYLSRKQLAKEELRKLYKAAGIARALYEKDVELYEDWKDKYSPELIRCAAECARTTEKPLLYMNKLLTEWEKSGISTPEAAMAQHRAHAVPNAARPAATSHNYQQRPVSDDTYGRDSYSDPTQSLE